MTPVDVLLRDWRANHLNATQDEIAETRHKWQAMVNHFQNVGLVVLVEHAPWDRP